MNKLSEEMVFNVYADFIGSNLVETLMTGTEENFVEVRKSENIAFKKNDSKNISTNITSRLAFHLMKE